MHRASVALLTWALLRSLCAIAESSSAEHLTDLEVVTPEVLLKHVQMRVPEVAALPEPLWLDNGRRVLLSIATAQEPAPNGATVPDYYAASGNFVLGSVDVASGQVTVIGPGYRPASAARGDTIAYFVVGSNDRKVTLTRANGERLCSIADRDLMPNADNIQSIALTADGNGLALAVGFSAGARQRDDAKSPKSFGAEDAAVRVLDTGEEPAESGNVALWITDRHCRKPRRVAESTQLRIGRMAWADRDSKIVAVTAAPVPGGGFPRSDLLLFDARPMDAKPKTWRTLARNIGGQASTASAGYLDVAPSGDRVAFMYDKDGLPYLLRKQLAVASIKDGRIQLVSDDPREGAGWLDAQTLWISQSGGHPLLSRAATLTLAGTERAVPDLPGNGIPSADGRQLAWLQTDLYGNSTLWVARVQARDSRWSVSDRRVVWQSKSQLARYARGPRKFVECQSSDGVRPAAILMLPLDYQAGRRYPLIVDIHGGPRGGLEHPQYPYIHASILNFSTLEHDMWAAKGYAVLVPDYRASGLYGFDKLPRDGSGFDRDLDDIMCNVQAVIDEGIVDRSRMAVIGHSYGGMEVNWIVTHSDLFRAAISKEGSFNVNHGLAWGSRGHSNQLWTSMYGAPYEFPERYRRMSVMEYVRGVTTPTLFVEHRGGKRAGDLYAWMFAAWQEQGVRAQLRLYDEEKHVLRRPADWKDVLDASISWIDEHVANSSATPPLSSRNQPTIKLP